MEYPKSFNFSMNMATGIDSPNVSLAKEVHDFMTYRVNTHVKSLISADCVVKNFTKSKIEYLVKP